MFSPFSDSCPENLFVLLENDAGDKHVTLYQGKYIRSNETYQSKPYWTNEGSAIWYNCGQWRIGAKDTMGKDKRVMESADTIFCPDIKTLKWSYWDDRWKDANGSIHIYSYTGNFSHSSLMLSISCVGKKGFKISTP